jgi:hypothetical protein
MPIVVTVLTAVGHHRDVRYPSTSERGLVAND